MQTRRDAIAIIVGVLLITAIGEPVRRLRLKRLAPKISQIRWSDDREETAPDSRGHGALENL